MAPKETQKSLNQETKLKILLAAKHEFAEHGFAGSRMDAIARFASVNKAMLHYYFSSKELLYKEVINYLVQWGVKNDTSLNIMEMDITPSQKLAIMIQYIIDVHFDVADKDFHRIIAWDFAEGKNCMKMLVRDYFAPEMVNLENIILQGIKNGEFSTNNPMLSVWNFIIFIISFINHQEIFEGCNIYGRLYGENPKQALVDFLLVHVFKSLNVDILENIPEIPKDLMEKIQSQILEIKKNRNGFL